MCDILPDLVLIETLVSGTMQLGEGSIQAIGNRLLLTLIDLGGETDAENRNHSRGSGNLHVEVDGVIGTSS